MEREDDDVLVQKVKNGDIDAFRGIVRRHTGRIYYLGLKFFHDHDNAEDFTQEVFLKIFKKLDSYKGKGLFKAWLYRIAFNCAVNQYHAEKAKREVIREVNIDHVEEDYLVDRRESVESGFLKKERSRRVREVLGELPDTFAIVIKMFYYDGLCYKDIARIMRVPLNTVKSFIFRAKKLIKKKLEL
ncbi:MAG: sigma-70 family RNA polymerase sigma factor [Spirochaetales bacterium]|nr:sigma-70 family RNA polymerase sigma factor [Spirochaetales bacterium]